MMTVVGIVGVLSAMAAFAFQAALRNGRISGEVRSMLGRIQSARTAAVSSGRCTGVVMGGHNAPANLADRVIVYQKLTAIYPGVPCGPGMTYAIGDKIISSEIQGQDLAGGGSGSLLRARHFTWDVLEPPDDMKAYHIVFRPDDGRPEVYLDMSPVAPAGPGPVRFRMIYRDALADPVATNPSRRQLELSPTGGAIITPNFP